MRWSRVRAPPGSPKYLFCFPSVSKSVLFVSRICRYHLQWHPICGRSISLQHFDLRYQVVAPCPGNIGFQLHLAGLNPGRVVALGDLDRRVAEQNRDPFHRHAVEEEFYGESVAEPVGMAIANARDFAQAAERSPPVARQRFLRADTGPEPVPLAFPGTRIERIN